MSEFEYLGPYRIGNVIGRGGMGSVYEATHEKSGEVVAVKLIAQHVADDPRFRRRFDAEVETLRRLRHSGIVRLIGYGEEDGRLFYSMELVQGESLQQRIRDVKRMGWLPCVDIAIQICAALKHAHDIGVIHRDLKPANLLLTPSNEVKLVDFGIAKLFGYGEQTMAGSVLGTADYMAPEQAGDGPITPRTDLYALGSVMYAMMSGRSPFAGKKLTQVIESLKKDRAVPLDLINPDVPPEVVEIVHQLLEKDPKDRPPTALAVMKRLKATRAGLQRRGTVALQDEPTRTGGARPAPPPSDTRDSISTHASKLDPRVHRRAEIADEAGTIERLSEEELFGDAGGKGAIDDATNDAMPVTQESRAVTGAESEDFVADVITDATPKPQTRFQSIDGDNRATTVLGRLETQESNTHPWIQFVSIAGMIAILVGGLWLFVRSVRTPSADELYAIIDEAESQGELTMQDNRIAQFLVHYPDDERHKQVQDWKTQAELERMMKRLQAQARRAGGVSRLEPAAQSFLQAMMMRETSTANAQTQLLAWLNVFDPEEVATLPANTASAAVPPANESKQPEAILKSTPTEISSPPVESTPVLELRRRVQSREIDQMARLARHELIRLSNNEFQSSRVDARLATLQERLDAADTLSPENREALLTGLIRLYQNESWASPIVSKAKAMIAKPVPLIERQ